MEDNKEQRLRCVRALQMPRFHASAHVGSQEGRAWPAALRRGSPRSSVRLGEGAGHI